MGKTLPTLNQDDTGFFYPYYSGQPILPQAQTPRQLGGWFSDDHPEYHLNANCFYGYLDRDGADPIGFSINQQVFLPTVVPEDEEGGVAELIRGLENRARFAESSMAISCSDFNIQHGPHANGPFGWILAGMFDFSTQANFRIQPEPYAAVAHMTESIADLEGLFGYANQQTVISLTLIEGTFGQAGARYMLTADALTRQNVYKSGTLATPTPANGRATACVTLRDTYGVISQGNSSAGFAPQFVGAAQQKEIINAHSGSVNHYLQAGPDQMVGLGVYSYSIPFLEVEQYQLDYVIDGIFEKTYTGNSGNLWSDLIVGTTDAAKVHEVAALPNTPNTKPGAMWYFFAIPIAELDIAITTTQFVVFEKSTDGTPLPQPEETNFTWMNVVDFKAPQLNPNGSHIPIQMLLKDQQSAKACYKIDASWTSPNGAQPNTYGTQFTLKCVGFEGHPELCVDLTLTALWDDQEVILSTGKAPIAKYEGMFKVTGTISNLPGRAGTHTLKGDTIAWAEIAPDATNN